MFFSWYPIQNNLDGNYYDSRQCFILFKSLIAGAVTNLRTLLHHVGNCSLKNLLFACSGPHLAVLIREDKT
jgi:hypothetical protein